MAMLSVDASEVKEVGEILSRFEATLIRYTSLGDLMQYSPAGRIALAILTNKEPSKRLERLLEGIRHRWPDCRMVVVGDEGGGRYERVARAGGALYLSRPVDVSEWMDVCHSCLSLRTGTRQDARRMRSS